MTSMSIDNQLLLTTRQCVICHSKAIGINFGVITCAPCKAFFRRNARRKHILEYPCEHRSMNKNENENYDAMFYLQIRRCSSCRLHRCFTMGMKEELVRTEEENTRHKELVERNRRKRELLKQKQEEKLLTMSQAIVPKNEYLRDSDWCHLSNIVSAYEKNCLKNYLQQRSTIIYSHEYTPVEHSTLLPTSMNASLFSFIRSLPAFHSLSQINRAYLIKNNLRILIFPTMFELNQTCYSEPWQISMDKSTWQWMCGDQLYELFAHAEALAEQRLITDPTIMRLWLIILFFSSPLSCYYDKNLSLKIPKKKTAIFDIQNAYIKLLWNYLQHRYGDSSAVNIYSNLVYVFLKMQRVGLGIGMQIRLRPELSITQQALNQLLTLHLRDS